MDSRSSQARVTLAPAFLLDLADYGHTRALLNWPIDVTSALSLETVPTSAFSKLIVGGLLSVYPHSMDHC